MAQTAMIIGGKPITVIPGCAYTRTGEGRDETEPYYFDFVELPGSTVSPRNDKEISI